jgi:fructose-bisphosphate aldolase class 1
MNAEELINDARTLVADAVDMAARPRGAISNRLDGLRNRLKEYRQTGDRIARWRAAIVAGECVPYRY